MSRRGGRKHKSNARRDFIGRGYNFWQSESMNNALFEYYRDLIIKIAMMRFKWVNLPPTCDARFLEWTLITQGVATIAFPQKMLGTFYSTQAVLDGRMNVYDNPIKWRSFGNNGWNFHVTHKNGVLVYDNATRFPLMTGIELYANELTHIRITKRVNRLHQQIPFILKGPQERKQDMMNLFKNVAVGEPAIIGTSGLEDIDFEALQTGVQFLGEELAQDEINVWNRIYTMLGMENSMYKAERQTEDEIRAQKTPTTLVSMGSLSTRRKAAEDINKRFGSYLPYGPIDVVINQDNMSENYNLIHNMQTQLRLAGE